MSTPVGAAQSLLMPIRDVRLPGRTTRFDYQSLDPASGLLYINHMGDGRVVVFDTRTNKVIADLPGFPVNTGILVAPELHRAYVSTAATNQVAVLDTRSLRVIARIHTGAFPDGIAFDPKAQKLFVSNEHDGSLTVIDAAGNRRIGEIRVGEETGNVRYDSASGRLYTTAQARDELVTIDPATDSLSARHRLRGCQAPHGLLIDAPAQLAFVACTDNARLLVVDLHDFTSRDAGSLGRDPDVLAFDAASQALYVASESGIVTAFVLHHGSLARIGAMFVAPAAHTLAVDSRTHRIYLPLEDVKGHPVLRIMQPHDRWSVRSH